METASKSLSHNTLAKGPFRHFPGVSPSLAGQARIDSMRLKSYLGENTLARVLCWRRRRETTSAKSQYSTSAASAPVDARYAQPTCSRVAGRLRARQKRVAPRGKLPNGLRRHQSDPVGCSPGGRLHDNPSDASNWLPGLAGQRDALGRQFDDVRQMEAVGISRLEFDQGEQPVAAAVCAIHTGYHVPVASRPERPFRVGERVILQLPRHPFVRL